MSTTDVALRGAFVPAVEGAVERVVDHVSEGRLSPGVQFYASHAGQVLADVAVGVDGRGRPMEQNTVFTLYCTGKPLTALAVGRLVDEGLLTFDTTLGDVLASGLGERVRSVPLRVLLNHTAGLHHLSVARAVLAGPGRRERLARTVGPVPGWRVGVDGGYSEHGAWELLGCVIKQITGQPASRYIREVVLAPLDLTDDLVVTMSDHQFDRYEPRLGVNVFQQQSERVPLLMERTRAWAVEEQLGYGAKGSGRALGRLYEHLLDVWHGRTANGVVTTETLRAMTSSQRPDGFDVVLQRDCSFGLGFMVRLRDHLFGHRVSGSAFGHSGNAGVSCAFADPTHELVVALIYNGMVDAQTSILLRRQAVSNDLYRTLGLTAPPLAEAQSA